MDLFIKKPLHQLMHEATVEGSGTLKRSLGKWSLVALGIGAIIGAGLFVRTAAAAGMHAGPAVVLSFVVAAIGCAFAGLCYAEFASMIPIAGSAYTYSYATLGELIAWIIGWDLVLEYAVGAATVSIAWSEYLNNLLGGIIPYQYCHSPFQVSPAGIHGMINLPALFIIFMLSMLLVRGTKESSWVNSIIVIVKVSIVLLFIGLGWQFINPAHHTPFIPEKSGPGFGEFGFGGIIAGAGTVFFAFIGFDAVSTAAQEAKNPQKDMPFGILVSLLICTALYILFSYTLTGIADYHDFADPAKGKEASVAYAIQHYMTGYSWLATFVTVAILAGFSSVILVMLMGQTRVFYTMSKDGLIPKFFSAVHPKYQTPYKSQWLFFGFVGLFAAFVPGDIVGDMTSIGTLFAFVLVCLGIIVMRKKNPDAPRPFKTPLVPLVPILGALVCLYMMYGLDRNNWIRLFVWLFIGMIIYFGYSRKNSIVRKQLQA